MSGTGHPFHVLQHFQSLNFGGLCFKTGHAHLAELGVIIALAQLTPKAMEGHYLSVAALDLNEALRAIDCRLWAHQAMYWAWVDATKSDSRRRHCRKHTPQAQPEWTDSEVERSVYLL